MMDCDQAENQLIDYLYDELSSSDKRSFELHLEKCPTHAKEVQRLKATLAFVREQPKPDMPVEWSKRVLAQAELKTSRKSNPLRFLWNPLAATVVVATVMLTVGIVVIEEWKPHREENLIQEEVRHDHRVEPPEPVNVSPLAEESKKGTIVSKELEVTKPRSQPALAKRKAKQRRKKKSTGGLSVDRKKSFEQPEPSQTDLIASKDRELKSEGFEAPSTNFKNYSTGPKAMQPSLRTPKKSYQPTRGKSLSRSERLVDQQDQSIDLFERAESYMAKKNTARAIFWYQRFLEEFPSDPRIATGRYRLARALFMSERCEQAMQVIQKAVSYSPRHPMAGQALLDQASCLVRQNRFQGAANLYRRIKNEYPDVKQDAEQGLRLIRSQLPATKDTKSNPEE